MDQPRLLACLAHPDDEAFPVGGTLATYAAQGVEVRLVCATLGEEGEIRTAGSATPETLPQVRHQELRCSCKALGIQEPVVWGYRDSGMRGTEANQYPEAFVNADPVEVVARLVLEIRRFKPQVVLTFGPDGLYGHPDHISIAQHTTTAFKCASDPASFPEQLASGLEVHTALSLFYCVRPKGFRMEMALKLRDAGIDAPLPDADRLDDGVSPDLIHLEMDTSEHIDKKLACMRCHLTQASPQRPYHKLPLEVVADIIGVETFTRGFPPVAPGEQVPSSFFPQLAGAQAD